MGTTISKTTVCKTSDIPLNQSKAFQIDGEKVLVFHLDDGFYATQAKCTHLFMSLALYVTPLPPCTQCAAAIIQRGITRVVVDQKKDAPENWTKQFEISTTMFREAGVSIEAHRVD